MEMVKLLKMLLESHESNLKHCVVPTTKSKLLCGTTQVKLEICTKDYKQKTVGEVYMLQCWIHLF